MMSLTDRTDGSWPGAAAGKFRMTLLPIVLVIAVAAGSAMLPTAAQAATPYVVAEVESGRVLMSEDATMPWYPASVTKLMTAYVALKQLKAGALSPDTAIPVSSRAAASPPSKIGAKPGTEITLENALKMMLVKSANDMAVVVAEGVGGTVEAFADMMNREAAAMGMRESRFVNPHGLFVEGQQTSARDMALLARSILLDFPEHADLFSIGAVQLGPRIMRNTNGLVGRYPGIEGMKTGFICASGFNLVAVASRNGRRIMAVVFGQPSAADRTIKAAALLDKGFQTGGGGLFSSGMPLDAMPHSAVATPPNVREDVCVRRKGPPASEEELESAAMPNATGDESGMSFFASAPQLGGLVNVRGSGGPRSLAPRTESDPIPVFLGRAPGSASAPLAANASKAVKPPITATAYAGGKGEGEDAKGPVLGSASGPLALKPTDNVLLRGASMPALKAAPLKTAKAAPGPVPPIAAKANATPAAKAAGKPVGSATIPATVKAPATVKPATASALGAKPAAAGKPMVLILDPKSPGSKPVVVSPSARKAASVPPAKTTPAKTTSKPE